MSPSSFVDVLGFLSEHAGWDAAVEIGIRADDLPAHDRPFAKVRGVLGEWRMIDDADRPDRGVAWVPIGDGSGFYLEGERARRCLVRYQAVKVTFPDHYVAVVVSER